MLRDLFRHTADLIADFFKKEEVWFLLLFASFAGILVVPNILSFLFWLVATLWWLWLFLILFPVTRSVWLSWRQGLYKRNVKYVLLELHMPREITKSPRAMEQVLAAINSLDTKPDNVKEKYWDGEVPQWFSLEMVSIGGEVHFYIRTPVKHRNAIEAAFFSYYSDIELTTADDYIDRLVPESPAELEARDQKIFAFELEMKREGAYPIKTYPSFEDPEESRTVDTVSSFLETLGGVKGQNFIGIQILIEPAARNWQDEWNNLLGKLRETPRNVLQTVEGDQQFPTIRSPGQMDVLKAVEGNLSKPAFITLIRCLCLGSKAEFNEAYVFRSIMGSFNQFSALHLNSFKPNNATTTKLSPWKWPHVFTKARTAQRRQRMLHNYRIRNVPPHTEAERILAPSSLSANTSKRFHLNTESVATLFHPPTAAVLTAPHVKRSESRKTGPPAGLAIFGDEDEIQKYL